MSVSAWPRIGHVALRRGRVSLARHAYHVTASTAQRLPLFSDFTLGCVAAQSFDDACRSGDASLLAWVLMPDHAHWLLQLGDGDPLSGIVNRIKSASARYVNRARHHRGPVWARAFHDHAIRSDESLEDAAAYITANPVRAGLATDIGDYPFWNTVWS
jgi:REP element-mobilizing transposase RayT